MSKQREARDKTAQGRKGDSKPTLSSDCVTKLMNHMTENNTDKKIDYENHEAIITMLMDDFKELKVEVYSLKEALAQKKEPEEQKGDVEIVKVVQGDEPYQEAVSHSTKKEIASLKKIVRRLEDESDHHLQYSKKGNVVLHSEELAKKLEEETLTDDQHLEFCLREVEKYSSVKVEKCDLIACHPLNKKGSAVLRFHSRRHDSVWAKIVEAIGGGGVFGAEVRRVKEANRRKERGEEPEPLPKRSGIFLNIQLSPKRARMHKCLRDLKKDGKIVAYYTDANGNLFVRVHENGAKTRLTMDINDFESYTYSVKQIQELV